MLKLRELALQPDFQLGPLEISPSRRLVSGPAGKVHVEPLIMQAMLLLFDARGSVVTRDELFEQCWGSATIGDDSLNRAVAKLRRTLEQVAPGLIEIETIPRTGYRLTGEILRLQDESAAATGDEAPAGHVSRRALSGGALAIAAMGAVSWWWLGGERTDPRVARLIAEGNRILIDNWPDTRKQAVETFQKAVTLDPQNPEAWGLLAYAYGSALAFQSPESAAAALRSERAARTALAIDPEEPNALLARMMVQRGMQVGGSREDEYLRILTIAPDNVLAVRGLAQLLHGVGRCRESSAISERAIALEPLSPDLQARNAIGLWVLGRVADADRVSNRTMELWPSHPLVRMARLMIFAFTGRTRAALAIVQDEETGPRLLSPVAASVWRASLAALETRTLSTIAAARDANLEGSKNTPAVAAYAILILSALGELDAAFEVASGFLLARGSVIVRPKSSAQIPSVNSPGWRNSFGLFTPPTKAMRLDPRFGPLSEGLGLTAYWRKRGVGPDAFLFKA